MRGPDLFEVTLKGTGAYYRGEMGDSDSCDCDYDHHDYYYGDKCFCSGQTVYGTVKLETSKELTNVISVTVTLKGNGKVIFLKPGDNKPYKASENYISKNIVVHMGNIDVGKHEFPFLFKQNKNRINETFIKINSIYVLFQLSIIINTVYFSLIGCVFINI